MIYVNHSNQTKQTLRTQNHGLTICAIQAKTVKLDKKLCLAAVLLQLLPNKINKNRRLGPEQVVFVLQFPAWDFIIGGLWCFRDRRRRLQRIVPGDRVQSRYIGPTLQGTVFPRVLSHQLYVSRKLFTRLLRRKSFTLTSTIRQSLFAS